MPPRPGGVTRSVLINTLLIIFIYSISTLHETYRTLQSPLALGVKFSSNSESASRTEIQTFFNTTITPPAVLLNPIGGIGNQLFQYACSYALAKEKNWPLYLFVDDGAQFNNSSRKFNVNGREFCLDQFKIPSVNLYDKYSTLQNHHYVGDKEYLERKFPDLKNDGFIQLSGYCQSPAYWTKYADEISQILQPSEDVVNSLSEEANFVLNDIKNTESVALHIRRGDFLRNGGGHVHFVPVSYQRIAIRRMLKILKEKQTPSPVFFVFSDDIDFAKKQFRDFEETHRFVYVSDLKTTSIQDLYLMIRCKHIILPNSTFSWWAAFLNSNVNKIVIASTFNPEWWKLWSGDGRKFYKKVHGLLYHPESWIVIDPFSGEQ